MPVHEIDASRSQEEIYDELMLIISRERTQVRRSLPSPLPLQPNRTAERATSGSLPLHWVDCVARVCIVNVWFGAQQRCNHRLVLPGREQWTTASSNRR